MTPKEKAKELVIKYINIDYDYVNVDFYDLDLNYLTDIMRYDPREFALIAIEFAMEFAGGDMNERFDKILYLVEVKHEIEKL
jgi:hypothetical protein